MFRKNKQNWRIKFSGGFGDGGSILLQNVGMYLPDYTVPCAGNHMYA